MMAREKNFHYRAVHRQLGQQSIRIRMRNHQGSIPIQSWPACSRRGQPEDRDSREIIGRLELFNQQGRRQIFRGGIAWLVGLCVGYGSIIPRIDCWRFKWFVRVGIRRSGRRGNCSHMGLPAGLFGPRADLVIRSQSIEAGRLG